MPRAKPMSTPRSRASRFAEQAFALVLTLMLAERVAADDVASAEKRLARFDRSAWNRVDAPPARPRHDPPPSHVTTHPDGWMVGFGLGAGPASPFTGWAEAYGQIVRPFDRRAGHRVRFGGGAHLHAGLGLSRMDRVDPTREQWVVPFLVGAEPSWIFLGARGAYLRVGLDLRLEIRRLPVRVTATPRLAVGVARDGGSFEVGVGYEPYIASRLASTGTAWDRTERATVIFFRTGTGLRR